MCHMSHVTYHLSLMPTATDPHPAYSPTMHGRLLCKDHKQKIIKTQKKKVLSFPILVKRSLTKSLLVLKSRKSPSNISALGIMTNIQLLISQLVEAGLTHSHFSLKAFGLILHP